MQSASKRSAPESEKKEEWAMFEIQSNLDQMHDRKLLGEHSPIQETPLMF